MLSSDTTNLIMVSLDLARLLVAILALLVIAVLGAIGWLAWRVVRQRRTPN